MQSQHHAGDCFSRIPGIDALILETQFRNSIVYFRKKGLSHHDAEAHSQEVLRAAYARWDGKRPFENYCAGIRRNLYWKYCRRKPTWPSFENKTPLAARADQ